MAFLKIKNQKEFFLTSKLAQKCKRMLFLTNIYSNNVFLNCILLFFRLSGKSRFFRFPREKSFILETNGERIGLSLR